MRKLQHTLIFAGLVAACLMAGCKKENPSQGTSFTAETEQGEANAKTGLVGSNIVWRRGDQIQLKNSSSPSQTETLTVADDDGIGTNKGKFYTSSSFNLNPPYTATYGVNIDNGAVSLPSTQTLTAANVASPGTIADGLMPMVATSSTNKLPFKNLLGGLCFKLTGSGNLTSIKITSSNTSEKLWGDFTANFADGTMTPTTGGTGSNELTVNCTGVTLSSTPQYFVVMLPPGSLASNYTVYFTCNGAVITQPATGNANLVQRSKIKTSNQTTNVVPPVTYTVTVQNSTGGTATGGGTYQQGQACTVTATPASGYICESWTIGGSAVKYNSKTYTFNVTSDVTITANFVAVPANAIPGLFYVGRWIWFSKGNVQYNNGTTWRFATNQYDRIGDNGQYGDENSGRARDVFAWSYNGVNHKGTDYYWPYQFGYVPLGTMWNLDYTWNAWYPNTCFAYQGGGGDSGYDLNSSNGSADWGYHFGNSWRTPTNSDWSNLLSNHTKGWSTVNGVPGYVIRPYGNNEDIEESYTAAEWATEEAKGTLFLPAAGIRYLDSGTWYGSTENNLRLYGATPRKTNYDTYGYYWSATHSSTWHNAYYMYFNNGSINTGETLRNHGCCVRLVKNR